MHTRHHKRATLAQPGSTGSTPTTQTAVASSQKEHKAQLPSAEDLRRCAYRKWESAGNPSGDGVQFWLEAEQELAQGK